MLRYPALNNWSSDSDSSFANDVVSVYEGLGPASGKTSASTDNSSGTNEALERILYFGADQGGQGDEGLSEPRVRGPVDTIDLALDDPARFKAGLAAAAQEGVFKALDATVAARTADKVLKRLSRDYFAARVLGDIASDVSRDLIGAAMPMALQEFTTSPWVQNPYRPKVAQAEGMSLFNVRGDQGLHMLMSGAFAQGGFGEVHMGIDLSQRERVAIKRVRLVANELFFDHVGKDPHTSATHVSGVTQVRNELLLMSQYGGSVSPRALGYENGWLSIVLPFGDSDASTIGKVIDDAPQRALIGRHIIQQAARGLKPLHDAGLIHRDIKPQNVLLFGDGRASIIDFGLAATTRRASNSPQAGTPGYWPPEASGLTSPDFQPHPKSDIWSLGMTWLELTVGEAALNGLLDGSYMVARIFGDDNPLDVIGSKRRSECRRRIDDDDYIASQSAHYLMREWMNNKGGSNGQWGHVMPDTYEHETYPFAQIAHAFYAKHDSASHRFLAKMLSFDPDQRPSADDVDAFIEHSNRVYPLAQGQIPFARHGQVRDAFAKIVATSKHAEKLRALESVAGTILSIAN